MRVVHTLKKYFKGFRTYYLLVISILVLTVAIQSIVQYSLNKQSTTAMVINLAGQQRALGQKLLSEVYACQQGNCDYGDVRLTADKLVQMDHFLKNGNRKLGITPVDDPEILRDFEKLAPHVEWFAQQFEDLEGLSAISLPQLQARADIFTAIMDEIVLKLQRNSESDIRTMMIIEVELAIFSVVIVLFEIFFIVNPIIKRLLKQKRKLSEIAWHQSHVFDKHYKNIADLEYVLRVEKNPQRKEEIYAFIQEELAHLKGVSLTVSEAVEKANEHEATPVERTLDKIAEWGRYWFMERRIDPRMMDRITRNPKGEKMEKEQKLDEPST